MANVSVAVEIETRTEHDLSTVLQGVADDQSVNVGTLVTEQLSATRRIIRDDKEIVEEAARVYSNDPPSAFLTITNCWSRRSP
jgi:ABC-type uncharacterized transport system involved in gliding motility auxiliary subunit